MALLAKSVPSSKNIRIYVFCNETGFCAHLCDSAAFAAAFDPDMDRSWAESAGSGGMNLVLSFSGSLGVLRSVACSGISILGLRQLGLRSSTGPRPGLASRPR